jgi:MerR family transcriptional regulator, light-induced transcriptional regulator
MTSRPLLSSRDVANLLGVSMSSVKRWADEGVLPCVKTAGSHRRFERATVERFRRLQAGAPAQASEAEGWVELLLARATPQEIEARLLAARASAGSWLRVAEDALAPAIKLLGDSWANGQISIAQEHLASERLARSLHRMGEWLPLDPNGRRALLLTADGDDHTLGLSLVELVLREQGWVTVWLGRRTPLTEIDKVLASDEAIRMVGVSASVSSSDSAALARQASLLGKVCEARGVELLLGGGGAWPARPKHGQRVTTLAELSDVSGLE